MYVKRLKKSNKIFIFLRPCKLVTGRYGIETMLVKSAYFGLNVNLPLFKDYNSAVQWLSIHYEKYNKYEEIEE